MDSLIWYRYKSYSDNRPTCYNGAMKIDDNTYVHLMVHYGQLVQLHILHHHMYDSRLYKDHNIEITSLANKIIMPFITKIILNDKNLGSKIFSIREGKIIKEW